MEWDTFLKVHNEFNRKNPKMGFQAPLRLDAYGVHLDLWGGTEWGLVTHSELSSFV